MGHQQEQRHIILLRIGIKITTMKQLLETIYSIKDQSGSIWGVYSIPEDAEDALDILLQEDAENGEEGREYTIFEHNVDLSKGKSDFNN